MTDHAAPDPVDARLERELRRLLDDRDPGPAPYGLRGRIDRVPDARPGGRDRLRSVSGIAALAGSVAAAVAAIAVVGAVSVSRPAGGQAPAASAEPAVSFDPSLVGPGVALFDNGSTLFLVLLALLVALLLAAVVTKGRRRALPLGIAIAVGAWLVMGQAGASLSSGSLLSWPSGVTDAKMPPGSQGQILYVTAPPGDPFWIGMSVRNTGPLPVRILGIQGNADRPVTYAGWTAAWLDRSPTLGSRGEAEGPGRPFAPLELAPGQEVVLWMVGQAGECSIGSTLDPTTIASQSFATSEIQPAVIFEQLGWQHLAFFVDDVRVVVPAADQCLP